MVLGWLWSLVKGLRFSCHDFWMKAFTMRQPMVKVKAGL